LGKEPDLEAPYCILCGYKMRPIDGEKQQWRCYRDDVLFIASEGRWIQPEPEIPENAVRLEDAKDRHVTCEVVEKARTGLEGLQVVLGGALFVRMFCPRCGDEVRADGDFCEFCGAKYVIPALKPLRP